LADCCLGDSKEIQGLAGLKYESTPLTQV
jgi:hypothetical protein